MSEQRFEDEGVEYNNNYNYALLDTHYEFDGKRIIEWNKHSDNAEYTDFERITEILNIKQMRLESLMKHREEVGKLFDRIDEQQSTITALKEENEQLRQMIKENVFQQYNEGSLADLKFKAIAYDDIIKVKLSYESEPKVIVICKQGKKGNVKSFCQMFIPFGVYYEIKEGDDE